MDFYNFSSMEVFTWIWLPLVLAGGAGMYSVHRSRQVIRLFYESDAAEASVIFARKHLRTVLGVLVLLVLCFALAGPRWNPKPITKVQQGRDIVVLLDVSKSMMCQDMKPNRLEQAKIALEDLLNELKGDRIALVVFAGKPQLLCPLTTDYSYFMTVLKEVDVNTVAYGGTLIEDAVHFAVNRVYPAKGKAYRDMLIITDGEDHGSFPVKAAEIAKQKKNVRMHLFGLGDRETGAKVPVYNSFGKFVEYRKYEGQFVYSRLDMKNEETLKKMALQTGGSYTPVGTKALDLGGVYQQHIAPAKKQTFGETRNIDYQEGFQVFILAGLVLLVVELYIRERRS